MDPIISLNRNFTQQQENKRNESGGLTRQKNYPFFSVESGNYNYSWISECLRVLTDSQRSSDLYQGRFTMIKR